MERRAFGRTSLQVSVLGLGGAEIGFEDASQQTVDAMLGAARDVGLNVIDTASMYGESEEKIGRALRGHREQHLLFTKCGRWFPGRLHVPALLLRGRSKVRRLRGKSDDYESLDWHPRILQWSIDQSLRRLRTDRIDLIQLHSCSEQTLRRGEVIEVLQGARAAGKVRHLGYSGDGDAALYAIRSGAFESIQMSINVADQKALDVAIPSAYERGMGIIAKRPIANSAWTQETRPDDIHYRAYWDRLHTLRYDFLHDTRAFEMAIRFAISTGAHTAIIGTKNPRHLRQNAEFASAGPLADHEFEQIRGSWRSSAPPEWVGVM